MAMRPPILRVAIAAIVGVGLPAALFVLRPSASAWSSLARVVGAISLALAAVQLVPWSRGPDSLPKPSWLRAVQVATLVALGGWLILRSFGSVASVLGLVAVGLLGVSALAGLVVRFSRPGPDER